MPVLEERTTIVHVSVVQLRGGIKEGVAEAIHQRIPGMGVKIKVDEKDGRWHVSISYYYGPPRVTWFNDEVNKMFNDDRNEFSLRFANKPVTPLSDFDFELNWCIERDTPEDVRQRRKNAEEEVQKGSWSAWAGRPTGPYQFPPEAFDDPDEINRKFPTYWPGYNKAEKEDAGDDGTSES